MPSTSRPTLGRAAEVADVEVGQRDDHRQGRRVDECAVVASERALDEDRRQDQDRHLGDPRLDDPAVLAVRQGALRVTA